MSFGWGLGSGRQRGSELKDNLVAILFVIVFFGAIVGMYLMCSRVTSDAYRTVYGDATPDPAAVAESANAPLYDGGDGRRTTRVALLVDATEDGAPERGEIAGPDQAVNYLYYTRAKRHITVSVQGGVIPVSARGGIIPVVAVIGPDGEVLAREDNEGGATRVELAADLPTAGYYTIRVGASADSTGSAYMLEFQTPGYFSPWEWPKLLDALPVLILLLAGAVFLIGKVLRVPVKGAADLLRGLFLASTGQRDPLESVHISPPQTMLVQRPPEGYAPRYEPVLDKLDQETLDRLRITTLSEALDEEHAGEEGDAAGEDASPPAAEP
jgi:hypothetical protein